MQNKNKTDQKKLKELIRVDHAGESGDVPIYEGQQLALNTVVNDDNLEKIIEENIRVPGVTDIIFSPDIYIPLLAFFLLILTTIILRKFFFKN